VTAGALVLSFIGSPEVSAASGHPQTKPQVRVLAKRVWPDGTVSIQWKVGNSVVRYDGPSGAKLSTVSTDEAPDGSGDATASVTVPGEDKSVPPAQLIKSWAKSHMASMKVFAAAAAAAPNDDKTSGIVDSWCVGWTDYSDNDVHAKTCNIRRLDWNNDGNWYFSGSVKGSAYTNDGQHGDHCLDCDTLNTYAATMTYSDSGNTILDWSPSATKPYGSCQDKTVSVTDPETGASTSQTDTVCPEHFGPYLLSNTRTGAKWDNAGGSGIPQNSYRDVIFNDIVHSPANVGTAATLTHTVWWG
jgi:hypothetical protein